MGILAVLFAVMAVCAIAGSCARLVELFRETQPELERFLQGTYSRH